jgi:hypothetical protein
MMQRTKIQLRTSLLQRIVSWRIVQFGLMDVTTARSKMEISPGDVQEINAHTKQAIWLKLIVKQSLLLLKTWMKTQNLRTQLLHTLFMALNVVILSKIEQMLIKRLWINAKTTRAQTTVSLTSLMKHKCGQEKLFHAKRMMFVHMQSNLQNVLPSTQIVRSMMQRRQQSLKLLIFQNVFNGGTAVMNVKYMMV